MRVTYNPDAETFWDNYYLGQAKQSGHGLASFQGMPYQRGAGIGSLFRSLFRLIVPIGKSAAKAIGKEALSAGANIAGDFVKGRSFKESAAEHGKKAAANLAQKAATRLQTGKGLGKRKATGPVKTQNPKQPKVSSKKQDRKGRSPGFFFAE